MTRASLAGPGKSAEPSPIESGGGVVVWAILLIPAGWFLTLAILLHDEWRARHVWSREARYRHAGGKTPSSDPG